MINEPTESSAKEGGAINYGPVTYVAGLLIHEEPVNKESSSESESDNSVQESSTKSESDNSDQEYLSEQESDSHAESLYQPRKGFHYPILDQLYLLLSVARNDDELFKESISFARDKIPSECWAKDLAEFNDPKSLMLKYLDDMCLNLKGDSERFSYMHYRAAARAYESCFVINQSDNVVEMRAQFQKNLGSVFESLLFSEKS